MAVFMINICKFDRCGIIFKNLADLIQHIEENHIDNESTLQYNNTKEIENATCLPLSYVLRFYTNKVKVEEDADDIVPNGHSTAVPVLPHHNVIKIQSPPPPPIVTTQLPSPSIVPAVSSSPQGSELGEDLEEENMLEDSNDSWTLAEEYSSEYILKHGSKMTTPVDGNVEKPFACPVPGCKKRYKNVNGIKYHSKNGHKTDGRAPPPPPVLLYPWTSSSTNNNTSEVTLPPSPLPVIPNSRKSRPSGKGRTRKVTAPIDGTSSKVGKITASNDGLSSKVGKSGNTPLNDGISSKFGKSGNIPLSGGISSQVGKLTNAPSNDGTSSAGFSSLIPQGNVSPNDGIFSQVGNLTSPPNNGIPPQSPEADRSAIAPSNEEGPKVESTGTLGAGPALVPARDRISGIPSAGKSDVPPAKVARKRKYPCPNRDGPMEHGAPKGSTKQGGPKVRRLAKVKAPNDGFMGQRIQLEHGVAEVQGLNGIDVLPSGIRTDQGVPKVPKRSKAPVLPKIKRLPAGYGPNGFPEQGVAKVQKLPKVSAGQGITKVRGLPKVPKIKTNRTFDLGSGQYRALNIAELTTSGPSDIGVPAGTQLPLSRRDF